MPTAKIVVCKVICVHAVNIEACCPRVRGLGMGMSSRVIEGEDQGWEASTPWVGGD